MSNQLFFRLVLLICLLVAASLGCQLVDNIRDGVRMIGTGRAIATNIGGLATQLMPAGIGETAMAFVTDVDTSGVLETAQAAITEKAPVIGETMQAVSTEVYTSPENAPEDIPVMDGELSAFIGSPKSVSYFINAELQDVADFYKREMPVKGWQESSTNSIPTENIIELEYEKEGRKAKIILTQIPFVGQTTVVISIEDR
jgi:hypothetical protein